MIAAGSYRLDDANRIAGELRPKISAAQASRALQLLMHLGFVRQDKDGVLRISERNISTGATWRSIAIKNYQQQALRLAQKAFDIPRPLRDISTVTVGVGLGDLDALREIIADFRSALIRCATENSNPDEIYQLNIQFFPVTNRDKRRRA
jgi:uncharacterized protein (TIGR02147 family)